MLRFYLGHFIKLWSVAKEVVVRSSPHTKEDWLPRMEHEFIFPLLEQVLDRVHPQDSDDPLLAGTNDDVEHKIRQLELLIEKLILEKSIAGPHFSSYLQYLSSSSEESSVKHLRTSVRILQHSVCESVLDSDPPESFFFQILDLLIAKSVEWFYRCSGAERGNIEVLESTSKTLAHALSRSCRKIVSCHLLAFHVREKFVHHHHRSFRIGKTKSLLMMGIRSGKCSKA